MERWNPQLMLDLYIYNYLIRKNMHTTAELFSREANFYPSPVAIDPPEGFLSEWWSLFWSVYSAKFPEATEASSSKIGGMVPQNFNPVMPSPDVNYMLQNLYPTMQPGFPNLLPTVSPTTMPTPEIGNLFGSDFSTMMRRPEIGNLLESGFPTMTPSPEFKFPISNFDMMHGQNMNFSTASGMHDKDRFNLPITDLNSESQFMNADQLAYMLQSSSNPSYPPEKVYKNPQLSLTRDDRCGTSLWRSTAAGPTRHPPKAVGLKIKPVDADSRRLEQDRLRLPVRNLNSNSQLFEFDRLACLLPSSSNCSHPQEKVDKKPMLSVTKDDKYGASLWTSIIAEPTKHAPKASPLKIEPANTDARRMREEHFGLPVKNLNFSSQLLGVDRLAPLLPSSSNYSHPQKNKKRQLSVTGNNKCGTSLKRSTAAEPTHLALKAIQPKMEPADADARIFERGYLGALTDLDSNSKLVDVGQLSRLLSSPRNFSHPGQHIYKKVQLSVTRNDGCGTSLRRSTAAEPTHLSLKAIHPKTEPADTGSAFHFQLNLSGIELHNQSPQEECSIGACNIDNTPWPNRQHHFSASAA